MEELSTCYKYSYDDYHMLNSIIILENFHWRVVRVFCMIICLVVIFVSTLFFVKYQRFDSVCNIILAVIFAILFLSINRVIEFVEKIKWRCGLFREHRITFTFYLNMFKIDIDDFNSFVKHDEVKRLFEKNNKYYIFKSRTTGYVISKENCSEKLIEFLSELYKDRYDKID